MSPSPQLVGQQPSRETVQFNRDIRPILSDKCYYCHGPDKGQRQTEFRLDSQQGATADLGGYFAVVAGDVEQSELIARILSADPSYVMPPPDHRKKLDPGEKKLLIRWIEQGAVWDDHWSLVPPQRHPVPTVQSSQWVLNWIDSFIVSRLEQQGLAPSADADRRTLIRRLSFDLLGLPPPFEEVVAFEQDDSPDAYARLVDRLLDSPHFGERMAIYWLDLVRYADSVGYHGDQPISVSPYRDYVIKAFNSNMPFDQFAREQLAGDLLAEPTTSQLVASGYNRLGMMSAEGGVQPREYLAKYAADRVRTTASVWLGVTLGCAECHDHKFDPFTSEDFYRFEAFFADIQERGLYEGAHESGDWGPKIEIPSTELADLLAPLDAQLQRLQQQISLPPDRLRAALADWERQLELAAAAFGISPLAGVPEGVRQALAVDPSHRTESQWELVAGHFFDHSPMFSAQREQLRQLGAQRRELVARHTTTTLITVSVPPREIRVLPRGNWMDSSGAVVQPGTPASLRQLQTEGRATRLDLANWLTARDNPLTARVMVNRLWKLMFGQGLSKVLDDVGSQGQWPTHPDLLDTLAVEFMESGWDVKHMIRLIVNSRTYRQSSMPRDDLRAIDPYNQLVARQARFRLDAEMIRDNVLACSGLLVRTIGGRSARPYQPPGLYRHLNFPLREYQHDVDENQYRRGLYTHWQRQFLHPALKTFDAPSREECTAQRPRSNTPLGALVLLNDPSYVEAARCLAERAAADHRSDDQQGIRWLFERTLSRTPQEGEVAVLHQLLQQHRQHYSVHPQEANKLLSIGLAPRRTDIADSELAAWTSVTRTLLNLHEFITRN